MSERDKRIREAMDLVVEAIDASVASVRSGGFAEANTNARVVVNELIARGWLVLPPEDQEPAR